VVLGVPASVAFCTHVTLHSSGFFFNRNSRISSGGDVTGADFLENLNDPVSINFADSRRLLDNGRKAVEASATCYVPIAEHCAVTMLLPEVILQICL
jgi:hypothetical protein